MFCKNCGNEFAEGVDFCPNCGTPVKAVEEGQSALDSAKDKAADMAGDVKNALNGAADAVAEKTGLDKKTAGKVVPIAICAVVVVVVLLILNALFGSSPKKAIKQYYKAFAKGDTKKMLELTIPKQIREDYIDEVYDIDLKDYYDLKGAADEALIDGLKEEGKVKIDLDIKGIEKIGKYKKLDKKDFGKMDLDDFRDAIEDMADYVDAYDDINVKKIKKVYVAEVKWTLTVDGDKAAKDTDYLYIFKYKGKWYIYGASSSLYYYLDEDDYEDAMEDYQDAMEDFYDEVD